MQTKEPLQNLIPKDKNTVEYKLGMIANIWGFHKTHCVTKFVY
jgi:hypothetical protein